MDDIQKILAMSKLIFGQDSQLVKDLHLHVEACKKIQEEFGDEVTAEIIKMYEQGVIRRPQETFLACMALLTELLMRNRIIIKRG